MSDDIQAEIAQIHEMMRSDRLRYERDGHDDRLRELYTLEDAATLQARAPVAEPDDGMPVLLTAAEARAEGVEDYAGYVARHKRLRTFSCPWRTAPAAPWRHPSNPCRVT